ncbi:MAG: ATP-grasp domain-containing protein, partial [Chloroflexi bacterium]|nr:ATP-grasp domain-containing protein [Chloroflexota bacterium]
PDSPAARLTAQSIVFENGWDDPRALDQLASLAQLVTLENEFVDWRILHALEERGVRVLPAPACVGVVQDKLLQKQALASAELPVPMFREIADPPGLIAAGNELGWPLMLKARRDGYDGRGNIVVHDAAHAEAACVALGWPARALFVEAFVEFERELATLVVRGQDGHVAQYPVVETRQDPTLHICREVLAPADLEEALAAHATTIARGAVEAVGGVGAFGVELFLLPDRQVCINELAPRPHNSAHYTIEACWSSQFDNHVRAVFGLPLGDPGLRPPAAAMVNLLGTRGSPLRDGDLDAALVEPRTFVHLYGKTENRLGRKMGHVTALGATPREASSRARATAARFRL